jgi:aminotransferase
MNVRREDIATKITLRTKAIMVVHYAGLSVDMDDILSLGFPVIEDAAHAVNSTYKGKPCGTIGDVGIYSFDAIKNLTTGEGGGITAGKAEMIERAKILRYCGIGKSGFDAAAGGNERWWEYNIQDTFIKSLPTNMAAGIGLAQIEKIDDFQKWRKGIWKLYQYELSKIPCIILPKDAPEGDRHSYFTFCIRVPSRNKLAAYLLKHGVYTTLRYHPLHMNKIFNHTHYTFPNSERLNEEALNIPIHPRMSVDDVGKVVHLIKEFYKS